MGLLGGSKETGHWQYLQVTEYDLELDHLYS